MYYYSNEVWFTTICRLFANFIVYNARFQAQSLVVLCAVFLD